MRLLRIMTLPPSDDRQDFVAGDLRVNEQPFLTSLHVLFMREHNRSGTVSLSQCLGVMMMSVLLGQCGLISPWGVCWCT